MTTTQVATIPTGTTLPAHLRTPEIAAQIAAENAAAAGGIKVGGFPSISIKGNKFHEKEGGELKTYMVAAQPGQPPLPMMCLEAVIVAANPALIKTYYPGDYVEGSTDEPTCRSSNGVTPDADVVAKQHPVCATCLQNQWGSKVSKLSGKDVKACDDAKQLAILPAGDLTYKVLGLRIGKGSLTNWGKYVADLTGRGFPIGALVTNITFDATANGILQFAFNRFLSPEECTKAAERAAGSDVKVIVAQSRVIGAPAPALAAPADPIALPSVTITAPVPIQEPAAAATGFGSTLPAAAPAGDAPQGTPPPASAVAAPEPPKRTRRTREQIAADNTAKGPGAAPVVDLSYLPPSIRTAVETVGATSEAGKALLVAYPPPKVKAPVSPFTGHPPHVEAAVNASGGVGTPEGRSVYKALTGASLPEPATNAVAPAPVAPVTGSSPLAGADAGAAAPPAAAGFGGTTTVVSSAPAPGVAASAQSLAERLRAKLGLPAA